MDFWVTQMIISTMGIVFGTVLTLGVFKTIFDSPMRRAKAEIMKARAMGELRDARTDTQILDRLSSLEQLVSIQNDEIKKLTDENEFFRRLLTDKVESKK